MSECSFGALLCSRKYTEICPVGARFPSKKPRRLTLENINERSEVCPSISSSFIHERVAPRDQSLCDQSDDVRQRNSESKSRFCPLLRSYFLFLYSFSWIWFNLNIKCSSTWIVSFNVSSWHLHFFSKPISIQSNFIFGKFDELVLYIHQSEM